MIYDIIKMVMNMKYIGIMLLLVFLVVISIIYYNTMLKKENGIKNALSSLDVMFKRRNDLIGNLVSVVKGYMKYESKTLERLISARLNYNNIKDAFAISDSISNDIKSVLALGESYPELKANEQFLSLQNALVEAEELISAGRRTYNAHVTNFNNFISFFPNLIFAKLFNFHKYALFNINEELKKGRIYYENEK